MKILTLYLIIFLGFLSISLPRNVKAEGASLSIYPPVIEVQTTPPSSPTARITIQNNNDSDVTLKIELIPFKSNNTTGEILLDPNEANKRFNPYIMDKIQFLVDGKRADSFALQALETKTIDLNINLAKGDPPGDYYYSIVFLANEAGPEASSVAQIPAGIATNLLLSVGPKDKASGGIIEFKTSTFKSQGPVDFSLKLHNASSHLIQPTGTITLTNLFGKRAGSVTLLSQYLLSFSDRYLVDSLQSSPSSSLKSDLNMENPIVIWPETFLFGVYKATATIQLEANSVPLTSSIYFIAFPLYFFFGIVILIFILASIYLKVKKKI